MLDNIVIIRGAGDIASGIAHRMHKCGFKLLLLETHKPLAIRRAVSFAQAVYDSTTTVEGVKCILAKSFDGFSSIWNNNAIPLLIDPLCTILELIHPKVIIDATLMKTNKYLVKNPSSITIAVGPGFTAGEDVDAVIESNRGHDLGKVIYNGSAEPDTGVPGNIIGYSRERIIKAPTNGIMKGLNNIGDLVKAGQVIAEVDSFPVIATIDGILRGVLMDGLEVHKDMKIGDIDPRSIYENCFTISDKALAIAGGVIEAIFYINKLQTGCIYGL